MVESVYTYHISLYSHYVSASSYVSVMTRVLSVVMKGHQQVSPVVVRIINRSSRLSSGPLTGRQQGLTSCPQVFTSIVKVVIWLWKVIRWERIFEKSSLVVICPQPKTSMWQSCLSCWFIIFLTDLLRGLCNISHSPKIFSQLGDIQQEPVMFK